MDQALPGAPADNRQRTVHIEDRCSSELSAVCCPLSLCPWQLVGWSDV